jgi:hypothetical protein
MRKTIAPIAAKRNAAIMYRMTVAAIEADLESSK